FGLKTGGILFLGPSESIGELGSEFEAIHSHWKTFRKRHSARLPVQDHLALTTPLLNAQLVLPSARPAAFRGDQRLGRAYDSLLDKHIPSGLLL
ncbi:hypothetical protein NL533_30325, partial [Klebsiella pneumoniae]|nr:hypothetical protein [Klebsiella pneumoniae]